MRTEQLHHILHRDTAPNKNILKQVTPVNLLLAKKKLNSQFVRHLLHREEGAVLSQVVSRTEDAVLRVWYKAMTGIYPVQLEVYLHSGLQEAKGSDYIIHGLFVDNMMHFSRVMNSERSLWRST